MTVVRRATPDDARAIADVQVASWRAAYVGVMPQQVLDELDVDARQRAWRSHVTSTETATYVAEGGGAVVGFVSLGPSRDPAGVGELYAIYVTPETWDTGAGRALMAAGVAWLGERWDEAILWVAEQNPRARRFYELGGWRTDGGRKLDEVAPGAHVVEVRYRLSGLRPL